MQTFKNLSIEKAVTQKLNSHTMILL